MLFSNELENFLATNILTRLLVSFSRDDCSSDCPRYVQDNLRKYGADVVKLIEQNGAYIYVCGDAKGMSKAVQEAFLNLFSEFLGRHGSL